MRFEFGSTITKILKRSSLDETLNKINKNLFEYSKYRQIKENQRYQDPKCLIRYENQIYSQNGEDGIIGEIFNRIGITNKFFVEIGVGNGLENNTAYLLLKKWTGCWIEADPKLLTQIHEKFGFLENNRKLSVVQSFVTSANVENIFHELNVPKELDLLSIDIDCNDYWVWNSLQNYTPRVIVIEYNSVFPPDLEFIIKYSPTNTWNGTSYFGASLKSLELLGRKKGYSLVGCDYNGVNAFFVRNDLIDNKFSDPFTAELHYESPKYNLTSLKCGHKRDFGEFC